MVSTSIMTEHTGPQQGLFSEYRTGRILGRGTCSIVKEAVHVKTGTRYACKVISKKLIEGREDMFRNEISVLNQISMSHPNIVTLHDYFETANNLYLCFELCTGGVLLDVLSQRGVYNEPDAARLIKTLMSTLAYIHSCDIVHGDLKPSNLLFRTKEDINDLKVMIADFGFSRIVDNGTLIAINEICGTPGYMAPEIFQKVQYGKPVDVWAMGVIAYYILGGLHPFYRDDLDSEEDAIIAGSFKFLPVELWDRVSDTAKDFITLCFTHDPASRPTSAQLLDHPWLQEPYQHFQSDPDSPGEPSNLIPFLQKATTQCNVDHTVAELRRNQASSAPIYLSELASKLWQDLPAFKEGYEQEDELDKTREFRRHTHPGPHKLRVQESSSSVREQMKEEDDIALSEGELHLQDVAHPMLYSSRQ